MHERAPRLIVDGPKLVVSEPSKKALDTRPSVRTAAIAWVVASIYYFYQYVQRSSPSVMMPQLSEAFGLSTLGVASIVGLFYYGYSPFSLVAGAAMDRLGPRKVVPIGAAIAGLGALLFATGNTQIGSIGRLLQGAGGVFAPVGAIYIASKYFPPSQAATLIGATQMFGMAGGAVGQFGVGPLISRGISWDSFWVAMGVAGLAIAGVLYFLLPNDEPKKRKGRRPEKHDRRLFYRLQESAVDFVRSDRRTDFRSHNHLRHDLGCALPAGGARIGLRLRGDELGDGSGWMDHRVSTCRLHFRSNWSTKAGHYRRCGRADGLPSVDSVRAYRRLPSLLGWIISWDGFWSGHAALHSN